MVLTYTHIDRSHCTGIRKTDLHPPPAPLYWDWTGRSTFIGTGLADPPLLGRDWQVHLYWDWTGRSTFIGTGLADPPLLGLDWQIHHYWDWTGRSTFIGTGMTDPPLLRLDWQIHLYWDWIGGSTLIWTGLADRHVLGLNWQPLPPSPPVLGQDWHPPPPPVLGLDRQTPLYWDKTGRLYMHVYTHLKQTKSFCLFQMCIYMHV